MFDNIKISSIDLAIIICYLLLILIVGVLVVRKQKMSSNNYFLAGRSLNWLVIGCALFASNISTIHLVGLASAGFSDGLVQGNFEWMAAFILIVLGLIFAPFYFNNKIATLPEFLEKRYNGTARSLLAFFGIASALFMHIGISLYAGAVVFENFFGIDKWFSIILIAVITSIYTVVGGLKSVVITETIQTVILLLGAVFLLGYGIQELNERGINSFAEFKNAAKPNQLSLLQTYDENPKLPWYSILLGYPVIGIWYWCADQTIVQRVLGAKTLNDAKKGPLFAGFLKILPVFFMVVPGIIAYVLFAEQIKNPNDALPVMITELLPIGLIGLISASLLAALMSTIASALNSSATLVSIDICKKLKPDLTDKKVVQIGRLTAVAVMILSIAWSPVIEKFISIFDAINQILAVLSPPIATVFLLGVFWKRGNSQGAIAAMMTGIIAGVLVFIIDFPVIGNEKLITEKLAMPYMMQCWWLFVLCCIVFVVTSKLTPPPPDEKVKNYTLTSPLSFLEGKITGVGDSRIIALILFIVMIVLYTVFK
ncbi:MAG: sodium:solute symporter [Chitinophagaceae bacterium]